ncbi:MAG: T9SS C-terminal target domain-containing protein [Cytophagales bacterium]|nr:MAG: T9SS C-terminal target domain-containing protein [Cytophagales bacterium]
MKKIFFFLSIVFFTNASVMAVTYYSQTSLPMNNANIDNWNTARNNSGTTATVGVLTSGTNDFVIQNGHTITIDILLSVNAQNIIVEAGGTLLFPNSGSAFFTVGQNLEVQNGATVTVQGGSGVHNLIVQKIINNGTIDLFEGGSVVNISLSPVNTNSITGTVVGFANFEIHNITLPATVNATTWDVNFLKVLGAFNVQNTTLNCTAGTIEFAKSSLQEISGNAGITTTLNHFRIQNTGTSVRPNTVDLVINGDLTIGTSASFSSSSRIVTINGKTDISGTYNDDNNPGANIFVGQVTLFPGSTFTTNNTSPYTFKGGVKINTGGSFTKNGTGLTTFEGNQNFDSEVSISVFLGDVSVSAGSLVFTNSASTINFGGTNFNISTGAEVDFRNSTISINGIVNNNGTLRDTGDNGGLTFLGALQNNGSVIISSNSTIIFGNGITNNGTFDKQGTGNITFSNNTQTITANQNMIVRGNVLVNEILTVANASGSITIGGNINIANTKELRNQNAAGIIHKGNLNGNGASATFSNIVGAKMIYEGTATPMETGVLNSSSAGTIFEYALNGNQNVKNVNYSSIIFRNGGTKTLVGNLAVSDIFRIDDNTTLDANNFDITLFGNWLQRTTAIFEPRNGTVTFSGSTGKLIDRQGVATQGSAAEFVKFNNLTLNLLGGVKLTLRGALNIAGTLTLNCPVNLEGSSFIRLALNAQIAGASATNYLQGGALEKEMSTSNSSFTFPIGTSTIYAPIVIGNYSGTTSPIRVEYFRAANPFDAVKTPLLYISLAEYWRVIQVSATKDAKAQVSLFWNSNTLSGISDVNNLRVASYSITNTQWEEIGGTNSSLTGTLGVSGGGVISNIANLDTDFTFGTLQTTNLLNDPSAPIAPTNLLLDVPADSTKVQMTLNWNDNSSNETGFEIYRSLNYNKVFEKIGSVGANISSYQDISLRKGVLYSYKIRAISGTTVSQYSNEQSGVIGVLITNLSTFEANNWKIYPNPVQSLMVVEGFEPNNNYQISIIDLQGKMYFDTKHQGQPTLHLSLDMLPIGRYTLLIRDGNAKTLVKSLAFIKQ